MSDLEDKAKAETTCGYCGTDLKEHKWCQYVVLTVGISEDKTIKAHTRLCPECAVTVEQTIRARGES